METITIYLTELDKDSRRPAGSFWAMAKPVSIEISKISKSDVENEVRKIFKEECPSGIKIPNGVYIYVCDKNDNKIFGGHITQEEEITLYPITEIFET